MTAFDTVAALWIVCSLSLIVCVLLARRRRGLLARELHELRGAITTAQLAVELAPQDDPAGRDSACAELSRTHDTLADFERLLHRRLLVGGARRQAQAAADGELLAEHFDAAAELVRLAAIWSGAAERLGRELKLDVAELPASIDVAGPRRHFTQVLVNLLANAVRHGDGCIELAASQLGGKLRVEVSDEGVGLPRPLQPGPLGSARSAHGRHGHGLHVAQASARALGGSLRSAPSGAGARIVLELPVVEAWPEIDRLLGLEWKASR